MLALRGARWAYLTFIAVGLAYFPMHVGFHFQPRACQLVFGPRVRRVDAAAPSVQRTILVPADAARVGGKAQWVETARRLQADLKLPFDLPGLVDAGYHDVERDGNAVPLLDADPQ